jgi:hypothetical protein
LKKISKYQDIFDKQFWGICLIAAFLIFGGTFSFSHYQYLEKSEQRLATMTEFI